MNGGHLRWTHETGGIVFSSSTPGDVRSIRNTLAQIKRSTPKGVQEMSQNTHNVRTRREQLATYPESVCVGRYSGDTWQLELDSDDLDADRLVEGPVLYVRCDIAHRSQTEAEARGAAEAEIVELRDREESAGWRYLTENIASDPNLPSCRLNLMFQEGDSRERIEETLASFGIEACWDVADWDWQAPPEYMEELCADDLKKCDPRTDLTDAGWKLVDAWDTEDAKIVRMYVRPIRAALTREGEA